MGAASAGAGGGALPLRLAMSSDVVAMRKGLVLGSEAFI
jgi:hypothetical protein